MQDYLDVGEGISERGRQDGVFVSVPQAQGWQLCGIVGPQFCCFGKRSPNSSTQVLIRFAEALMLALQWLTNGAMNR